MGTQLGGGTVEGWETVAESSDHVVAALGGAEKSRDLDEVTWWGRYEES